MRLGTSILERCPDYEPLTRDSEGRLHGGFGTINPGATAPVDNNCDCAVETPVKGNNCKCRSPKDESLQNNCKCQGAAKAKAPDNNCNCDADPDMTSPYAPRLNNCDCKKSLGKPAQLPSLYGF
jgi:hypothetical protein